jgi:unsaturated chondroitin disaccharide hydrolase
MRSVFIVPIIIGALFTQLTSAAPKPFYDVALDSAKNQLARLTVSLGTAYNRFPRTWNSSTNSVVTVGYADWTSGFFPGSLWLMYRYTNDPVWKTRAQKWTDSLTNAATTNDHDVGFRIFCSFGTGLPFVNGAERTRYTTTIMQAAATLATHYSSAVKAIKSWNSYSKNGVTYNCPVIVDNMMNLELLCWASKTGNITSFLRIANSHAQTTLKNHFRPDFSSYHLVAYDATSGAVIKKMTVQGYADASSWARGQAWGLYGFTMMFRETGDSAYLTQARHIADYIISRLPADQVPLWDFDAPANSNPPRDASAAAIYASALLELSTLTEGTAGAGYYQRAKDILQVLCSSAYAAASNTNGNFILKHCTGHKPAGTEIDVPINYADYYFIEALLRLKALDESTATLPEKGAGRMRGADFRICQQAGSRSFRVDIHHSNGPVMLNVFDTRGRIVKQQSGIGNRTVLDLSLCSKGSYVVQAHDTRGCLGVLTIAAH